MQLVPGDARLPGAMAWLLATSPEASLRDGARAVELAQRAVRLTGGREPDALDTLAAAYAEAGRFAEAVETAEQPAPWPPSTAIALAEAIEKRLDLDREGPRPRCRRPRSCPRAIKDHSRLCSSITLYRVRCYAKA